MALAFLDQLFASLDRNRKSIGSAATSLARRPLANAFQVSQQLRRLMALVRAQDREIEHLRVIVKVVAEHIAELGLDPHVFEYRVEAELDRVRRAREAPPRATGPGGPYRGG